jgi:AAA ATPase domain
MPANPRRQSRATELTDRRRERDTLDRLIEAVRAGQSRALVVRGEPGVGKTVLLDYLTRQASGAACRVAHAVGMQSEMELAFAGVHQLCTPLLSGAKRLPGPQHDALRTAFGLAAGPPPDRFFVGLAVLSLLSEGAGERPLVCVVDDAQWLDRASAQVLGFAARRLAADPVGLVFAARDPGAELAGLPELEVEGLRDRDARALLETALTGPLDARVRDLIVAETRGNPLALLELPRGLSPEELAGGFGLPGAVPLAGRIEGSFARQLDALPAETRRLLQLASADPSGDRSLVWKAAMRLGIPFQAGHRRRRRGWSSSASRCGSGTRWRARRPTGQRRCPAGGRFTRRWRRLPTRRSIRIAGRGTGPRPRPGRTMRSPLSSKTRPGGRRLAAEWLPQPRSCSAPSRFPPIRHSGLGGRWPRRRSA